MVFVICNVRQVTEYPSGGEVTDSITRYSGNFETKKSGKSVPRSGGALLPCMFDLDELDAQQPIERVLEFQRSLIARFSLFDGCLARDFGVGDCD